MRKVLSLFVSAFLAIALCLMIAACGENSGSEANTNAEQGNTDSGNNGNGGAGNQQASHTEHTYGEWQIARAATCSQAGEKVRTCSCGAEQREPIEMLPHTIVPIGEEIAATCTENGRTAGEKCSVCNRTIHIQEPIYATGHDYEESTVAPTGTAEGYDLKECKNCNDKLYSNYVLPNGAEVLRYEWKSATSSFAIDGADDSKGSVENIVIPDSRNGYPVDSFFSSRFRSGAVKNITIGKNITEIPSNCFSGCVNLETITIGKNVTKLGLGAFSSCQKLKKITFGESVKTIEKAFYGCENLIGVYYTGNLEDWFDITFAEDDEANPLRYAHNLYIGGNLLISLTIPESVTEINQRAFCGATCLTHLEIGHEVTIGERAFAECYNLLDIYNNADMDLSGKFAFSEEGERNIYTNYEQSGDRYSCGEGGTILYEIEGNTVLLGYFGGGGDVVFSDNAETKDFVDIWGYAFYGRDDITSVDLPKTVKRIAERAFLNCYGLKTVYIDSDIEKIGYGAFKGCESLTDIYYNGTEEQWNNVNKDPEWTDGQITIHFNENNED